MFSLDPQELTPEQEWPSTLAGMLARPLHLATPEAAPAPCRVGGRYRVGGEVAHGGVGAVLRAHDLELDRPLAVKVLLPGHQGQPEQTGRFLAEGRVTAQLQHPGIPPVHDVGTLPDGRLFFAMKLIEGCTLAQLLRVRPGPSHDLSRFLRYFEAVCQTVAYAHSRGVIHRDLKPSNVMLGAFGEVYVMDWGLARSLASRGPSGVGRADDAGSPADETVMGSVLGTPAYMAPEQARGEVERIDQRTDVFGLGAILCEILTGLPPYADPTREALNRAAEADLSEAFARLDASTADAELVRLARGCLAVAPEDRPRGAALVARAVADYQSAVRQRLLRAEREQAMARANAASERGRAAAERRARRLLAALLLVVLAVGCALLYERHQAAQDAERDRHVAAVERDVMGALHEVAREQVKALKEAGRPRQREAALARARAALRQAETLLEREQGQLDPSLRSRVSAAGAALTEAGAAAPPNGK
jgi:serine/threonine-protein kinase